MIGAPRSGSYVLLTLVCLGGSGCQLRMQRPTTTPSRMIEPQVLEPQLSDPATQVSKTPNATPVRLLDTQARGHIGRHLLRQLPNGELTEDSVWRWSSAPDRYLDTALRLEMASSPNVRLVDTGRARTLAATLLVWDLESAGENRLVGAVEFQVTEQRHWSNEHSFLRTGRADQIANCRPISKTISLGRRKYSIASLELRSRNANVLCTRRGSPLPSSRGTTVSRPMK